MTRKNKKRIIAVIMSLIILVTVAYVFYGKNWLAEQQFIQKHKNSEFLTNDLMQQMIKLEEQSQEILEQLFNLSYNIEIFKMQEIDLEKTSELSLDDKIIKRPVFDYKSIYLLSSNKLCVIDKSLKKIKWQRSFDDDLINIQLLDANRLMLINRQNKVMCLNRNNGNEIWEKTLRNTRIETENTIYQISLNKYKQLDNSIILSYSDTIIELFDNLSAKSLAIYKDDQGIDHVSDFDVIEKCVYYISKNKINKLEFKIKS